MPLSFGQPALKLFIPLIAIFCLVACTDVGVAGAPPTIKIGLVAPFEGLHRPLGYEALFAVKLALQERNQDGGVNGYRVELVALNDFDNPTQAKIQAQALVADPDVLGVVGHLSTATSEAAMPVYQEADLAMSIPWTIAVTALDNRQTGIVSVAASSGETSARLAEISQAAGYSNLAKLTNSDVKNMADDIQAVELETDGVSAGEIILALKHSKMTLPVFGHPDVGSPQVVEVAKDAANGLTYVSPGPAPGEVNADVFADAYQTLAGFPPGPRAVLAYDATNVLLDAFEKVIQPGHAPPTRTQVSAVINNIRRQGLSGDIAFDDRGQRINAPVWVYQIFNEKYPGALLAPN